ncbi:MAG: fibronectin type III domain-containing protein [Endomicrobia bacterium]|nr:fibronectin type III domain-containing protein [Endomicrobiia bacterium]
MYIIIFLFLTFFNFLQSQEVAVQFTGGTTDSEQYFPGSWGGYGQSFTVGNENITVSKIELELRKSGNPSNIYVQIRSGSITGTSLGQSAVVTASQISDTYSWVSFTFDPPINLNANTKYYIALLSTGQTGYVYWRYVYSASDQYSGGEMWRYVDVNTQQYPNFYDANFKVYKGVTDTIPPAAVTTLSALTSTNGGEIKLNWLAVGDDGYSGNIVNGAYAIQRSSWFGVVWSTYSLDTIVFSTGNTVSPVVPSRTETYILKNLFEGVTYYIRLWTRDEAGNWSSISNGATAWAQVYPLPQNVKILSVNVSSITVCWDKEITATGYILQASSTTDDFTLIHQSSFTASVNLSTLTVSGLYSNTTYYLRVGCLFGSTTKWIQNPLYLSTATLAETPSNLSFLAVYVSSVVLSWTDVNCQGYMVETSTVSSFVGEIISSSTLNGDLTQLTVEGVYSNTTYYFRLGALNWNNVVNYAPILRATSTLALPVENVQIYAVFESSVTLNWKPHLLSPSSSSCVGYIVEASSTNFGQLSAGGIVYSTYTRDVNLSTLTIRGLLSLTTYWFRIGAINHNNIANYMFVGSTKTLSDIIAPTSVTTLVAIPGSIEGEVKLSWLSVGDDGLEGVLLQGSQFKIQYSSWVGVLWSTSSAQITVSTHNVLPFALVSYAIKNLGSGITYYFKIWYCDEVSNWSGISNTATSWAQVDVTKPGQITTLSASVVEPNSIKLSWLAPGDDGFSNSITNGSFIVRYSTYNGDVLYWNTSAGWNDYLNKYELVIPTSTVLYSNCSITITGLKNSNTYYFYVWTKDEKSNQSEISNLAHIFIPDTIPPANITDLFAITNFNGVKEGDIKLVWTAVGNDGYLGRADKYIIKVSTFSNIDNENDFLLAKDISEFSNVQIFQPSVSGTKEELIIEGLTGGVSYFFAIKVVDDKGNTSQWVRNLTINKNNYSMAFDSKPVFVEDIQFIYQLDSVVLIWSYNFNNIKDFNYFEIYVSSSYTNWNIYQTTSTYFVLQNPLKGTTYYFRIYVVDNPPYILRSDVKEIYCYVPFQQQNIPPTPIGSFYGTTVSTTSILWKWEYISLDLKKVEIYSNKDNLIYSQEIDISSPTTEWLQENMLPNTSSYVYYIVALNDFGSGSPTYVLQPVFTLSNPPSDINIVMVSSVVYAINFSSNNNPQYTRYAILISSDGINFDKIKDKQDDFTIDKLEELELFLSLDTLYFIKIFSYNEQDIPSESVVITTSTYDDVPPAKITDLKAVVINNKVMLSWTAVGDNGYDKNLVNAKYIIKYSTDFSKLHETQFFVEIATHTQPATKEIIILESLPENVTVYFSIEVRDDYGNLSERSNVVSVYIDLGVAPKYVAGVKTNKISSTVLMLKWSAVTKNQDNTVCKDLLGYNIYKSTTDIDNFKFLSFVSSDTLQFIDITSGSSLSYYFIKAVNSKGKESNVRMLVSSNGDVIFLKNNKEMLIKFSSTAAMFLYKNNNFYEKDLVINITKENLVDYILTYNIEVVTYEDDMYVTMKKLDGFFNVEFYMNGYVLDLINVYYWYENDNKPLKLSSEIDTKNNIVKIKTPLFGKYSLKEDKKVEVVVKLEKVFPKVFTPLSLDSKFNNVVFYFSNPHNLKLIDFKIYDIQGNVVKDGIKEVLPNLIYEWDGRDNDGSLMISGVYLYEARFEKNIFFNGTIILAK